MTRKRKHTYLEDVLDCITIPLRIKFYLKSPGLLDLLAVEECEGRRHHHQARDQQPEGHRPGEINFETIKITKSICYMDLIKSAD